MATEDTGFNATAVTLSRNPLGIIALFIVLVYAMASLTLGLSTQALREIDKTVMVWFLAIFPILVLGVFTFLVGWRTKNLYAPSDFTDQQHWVDLQKQVEAVAQLTAVTVSNNEGVASAPTSEIVERSTRAVERATTFARSAKRPSNGILWVDDKPERVAGLRRAFENFKIPVEVATGNAGALSLARQRRFDAIVTDMEHDNDKAAGLALAEQLRDANVKAPVIVFTTAKIAANLKDPRKNLVSAVTSSASDLFQAVTRAAGG